MSGTAIGAVIGGGAATRCRNVTPINHSVSGEANRRVRGSEGLARGAGSAEWS